MDNLRAIGLMVLAMGSFALADVFIKTLGAEMPLAQIMMTMGALGGTLFALVATARRIPVLSPTILHPALLVRNLAEMVGTLGFMGALTLIPLSTASAISQAGPLFVTLGAATVLREPVGWRRWAAVATGFAGVLIMLKPETGGVSAGALLALLGAAGISVRDIATRFAPPGIHTLQLATWAFFAVVAAGAVLLPFSAPLVDPLRTGPLLQLGMVAFATAGYFMLTASVRLGEISVVAPFRYSRIVFAFLFGVLILGETLSVRIMAGAALVVAAGVYALLRERKRKAQLHLATAPQYASANMNPHVREP